VAAEVAQGGMPFQLLLPATIAPALTDDALLAAFAAGSVAAFDTFYGRHEVRVYQYLTGMLCSHTPAQRDAAFARTWQALVNARQTLAAAGRPASAWLYGMAHQQALVAVAATHGSPHPRPEPLAAQPAEPTGLPWEQWPVPTQAGDPAEDSLWSRAGQRLLGCLERLPALTRSAFLLHHGAGLSVAELAAALGGPAEEAEHRLHGAMQALRAGMGAYDTPPRP
jgi:DNA-directed RNA polymerase specialized sigma24 family protein